MHEPTHVPRKNRITNPKKLLLSKWTALHPKHKEKHFLVTEVIQPEDGSPITEIILEAIYSKRAEVIAWKTLEDGEAWQTGWR